MPILSYSKIVLIIQIAGCFDNIMGFKAIIPICCSEIMKINGFGRMAIDREVFRRNTTNITALNLDEIAQI